jgi:peptidoglycan/LPS O-acetylase OafA/YrhL
VHIFMVLGICTVLAYITHVLVEKPFINIGKKVAKIVEANADLLQRF